MSSPHDLSHNTSPSIDRGGLVCAIGAHTLWGLFPIYWHLIDIADSAELVSHRIVWSFVSFALVLPFLIRRGTWGGGRAVMRELRNPRVWIGCAVAAVMIATNWAAFIWAVNHGRVLDASLGYYINPLVNVLLGVMVLGERLDRWQWVAVGVAAVGVGIMAVGAGGLPWVSVLMACSFGVYGLVKKRTHLPPLLGLWIEVSLLFLPAAIYLGWRVSEGASGFQLGSLRVTLMLLFAGVITITPLALFANAVRKLDLSLIGILQYVGPTLQFLVGAVLYNEPLDRTRMCGFVFVWLALILFVAATHRPRSLGTLSPSSTRS
ncbi:EamA family transporter RarD [Allorhodopirellula solitaria]|uniref:Putative DMT superfamily transporter inner membrane protein n=1 Tax=Allorhodopirellula solitaria TaxID=2527987 RepID=A0A5C5YGS5_9BACT|nr:EamA family transporter RarD [Allorhodopirellula solitaria]TWT74374.1 putative DMT superfamily transporter inner membrane protein [Allorhodopirellula solitaria]